MKPDCYWCDELGTKAVQGRGGCSRQNDVSGRNLVRGGKIGRRPQYILVRDPHGIAER